MFEHQDIIKKINMKIAGTLQTVAPAAGAQGSANLVASPEQAAEDSAPNMDGLTAKQRKNLKKKMQRKKKKQQ